MIRVKTVGKVNAETLKKEVIKYVKRIAEQGGDKITCQEYIFTTSRKKS